MISTKKACDQGLKDGEHNSLEYFSHSWQEWEIYFNPNNKETHIANTCHIKSCHHVGILISTYFGQLA